MYTGTIVLGEFSELQYSLCPSYQAERLLVFIGEKLHTPEHLIFPGAIYSSRRLTRTSRGF